MFSGIVGGVGCVIGVTREPALLRLCLELPLEQSKGIAIGASIAIEGVCLTVTRLEFAASNCAQVFFDVINSTLLLTTLSELSLGSLVNVERSIKVGDEVGGHVLSGHIMFKAQLLERDEAIENNLTLHFEFDTAYARYLFAKGYIAINGVSLTLVGVDLQNHRFYVSLIPETLRMTTFGELHVGAWVNIEIDTQTQVMVDTVERFLSQKEQ